MTPIAGELFWDPRTIGYVKDISWLLRLDFHFRSTLEGFWAFVILIGVMCLIIIALGAVISFMNKKDKRKPLACRIQRALFTSFTNCLLVPMSDTLLFGASCGLGIRTNCGYLSDRNTLMGVGLLAATCMHLVMVLAISCYYQEFCSECGSMMAKPHPRFKIGRTLGVYIIVMFYNFTGESSIFPVVVADFVLNGILIYCYLIYLPYYHLKPLQMRLASVSCSLSLSISTFVGFVLADLDPERAGASLLFYFLSISFTGLSYILLHTRIKYLTDIPEEKIPSYYLIEVKARFFIQAGKIHEAENLYRLGLKKYPNDELLYLWSGLFQLHFRQNHISGVIQCFRGMELAKKFDTKYMFYHFRKTSLSFYKQSIKSDAYSYTKYEKCHNSAITLQTKLCNDKYEFILELNNNEINLPRLQQLAKNIYKYNDKLRSVFERMMSINDKHPVGLKMYAEYLESINDFYSSSKFVEQADIEEKANSNLGFVRISFFDEHSALLKVSIDRNSLGEVIWINSICTDMLGFYPSELVGRNIWEIVAPIVTSEKHNSFLLKFQDTHNYHIIDTFQERFFRNKKGWIFLAKFLVTIVPAGKNMPYFMAVIHKTLLDYDVILLDSDHHILGFTENLYNKSKYKLDRSIQLNFIIPEIDDIFDQLRNPQGHTIQFKGEMTGIKGSCFIVENSVGGVIYHELRVNIIEDELDFRPTFENQGSIEILHGTAEIKEEDLKFPFKDYVRSFSNLSKPGDCSSKSSEEDEIPHRSVHIRFQDAEESEISEESKQIQASESSDGMDSFHDSEENSEQQDLKSNLSSKSSVIMSKFQYIRRLDSLLQQRSKFARASKLRVKLCLLFIGLIYLCALASCAGFLNDLLNDQIEKTQNVLDAGNMRHLAQELSYSVRILGLMKQGFIPDTYQQHLTQKLEDSASKIHKYNYNLQVQNGVSIDNDEIEYIPLWELMPNSSTYSIRSLHECLDVISLYAIQLSFEEIDLPHLNRDTFAIYRNGAGETLKALNISSTEHMKISASYYNYFKNTVDTMLACTVIITILSIAILSIPPIIQLYRLKIRGWQVYFTLPHHIVHLLLEKTASQLEFFKETALTLRRRETNEEPKHTIKGENKVNTSKKITKDRSDKYCIGIKLTAHLIISAIIIVIIYILALNIAGAEFEEQPWIFDYASRRQQLVKSINMWVTEAIVANIEGVGMKYVIPHGQIVQNPLVYAEIMVDELETVENAVIYGRNGDQAYKLMNNDQKRLVFNSACDECGNILEEGLHSTIDMYIGLARYIIHQVKDLHQNHAENSDFLRILQSDMYTNLMKYGLEYLEQPLSDSLSYYFNEYENLLMHAVYMIKIVIILYGMYFLTAYFLVFSPMAERMSQEVIEIWNMSKYLPYEFQEYYITLNKAIHKNKSYG
jgi:PAS domain-containing protein